MMIGITFNIMDNGPHGSSIAPWILLIQKRMKYRPWTIMLKILPIMLLSSAQKIAHYDHKY